MDNQTTIPIGAEDTLNRVRGIRTEPTQLQSANRALALAGQPTMDELAKQYTQPAKPIGDVSLMNANDLNGLASVSGADFANPEPFDIRNIELPTLQREQDNITASQDEITKTLRALEDRTQFTNQVETQLGLPEQRQELQDITGQLRQLQAEAQAQQARASGQAITEGSIQLQRADISRQLQEQALPLAARANVIQGNIGLAEAQLDRLVSDKFDPILARLDTLKFQLDVNKDQMTRAEKRRAEILQIQLDERERLLEEQKNIETQKNNLFITAAQNKAPQSVLNQIRNAQTYEDALNVASNYIRTPVSELDQLRIQEQRLKNQQLQQEIDLTGDVSSSEYNTVINNLGNLVGSEKGYQRGQEVKKSLSQTIASGDLVSAYSQIANTVGSVLTGESKTRYENSRTDLSVLSNLRDAIAEYASNGGDMGLLTGKAESIKRKLGIDSGEASELAVQLWREFQTYRNIMTGAAFTPEESRDYASVNPTLGKSLDLNLSVIDGAMNQLENRVTSTINTRIPGAEKIYNKAFPQQQEPTRQSNIDTDFQQEVGIKEEDKNAGFWSNIGSAISSIFVGNK